ncbi:MAG: hypothetical protein VX519_04770 [Myxococcota bacterium]|nr:hypothetical protein [Myxococcota bacterium]
MIGALLSLFLCSPVSAEVGPASLEGLLTNAGASSPSLAVVCSPVSNLVSRLEPIVEHPLSVEAREVGPSPILDLLSHGGLARSGLQPEGQMSLELWPQGSIRLHLPFEGNQEQLSELLQVFPAETLGEFLPDLEQVVVRFGEPEPSAVSLLPGLFDGLPELPGCAVYIARQTQGPGPLQQEQIGFVLDPVSGVGVMRSKGGVELPELEMARRLGAVGSSIEKPEVLVRLGVAPDELIESFWEASSGPVPAAHRRLVRRLGISRGLSFAMYDVFGRRDFAVVVPLGRRFGLPIWPWLSRARVEKMFQAQEIPCESRGRRSLTCQVRDETVHAYFKGSLIVLSSREELGQEVASGQGVPWTEQLLVPPNKQFLLLGAVDLALPESGERIVGGVGAMLDGPLIEAHFSMDADLGWTLLNDRLAKENHARVLEAYRQRGWTEIVGVVDQIYEAVEKHQAGQGGRLVLEPAPRSIDALTTGPVEWSASGDWHKLDWGVPQDAQGVYWVEFSEDGASFVVHGACDSDGDGIAAHFSRTLGQALIQRSSSEIY